MINRCRLPNEPANASYYLPPDIMNMSYPIDYKTKNWSSCKLYDVDFTEAYYESRILANQTRICDNWVYDQSSKVTALMEVNIIMFKSFKIVQLVYVIYVYLCSLIWCVKEHGIKVQQILCWWSVSCLGQYYLDICLTSE